MFGIGCYTVFSDNLDVEVLQALHGRAPSLATGVKRAKPETVVFTVQGDGDMVNEGLQEVIHTAARGENVTCILLNNGVFGETGGHMTATTVLGQRTKNTLDGRDAAEHGYPILIANLIAQLRARLRGRGAVNTAGNVAADEADVPPRPSSPRLRGRVHLRRDPHHVPDGLVHRDAGGPRLPRENLARGARPRGAQGHRQLGRSGTSWTFSSGTCSATQPGPPRIEWLPRSATVAHVSPD